jgi:SnoaL-like polyketide cyclase
MPITPSTIAEVLKEVRDDVIQGYADALEPRGGSEGFAMGLEGSGLAAEESFATSDDLVAVPWTYACTQTGPFLDIQATQVDLVLRGVTFVQVITDNPANWWYYRYVDYLGALHQLGVSTSVRPALSPDEYQNWITGP